MPIHPPNGFILCGHFKPRLKPFPGGLKCKMHFSGSQDSPNQTGKTHSQYLPNYGSLYLFIKFKSIALYLFFPSTFNILENLESWKYF